MKCPVCLSCFDKVIISGELYYRCWFCKRFYIIIDKKYPKDVTEELIEKGLIDGKTAKPV